MPTRNKLLLATVLLLVGAALSAQVYVAPFQSIPTNGSVLIGTPSTYQTIPLPNNHATVTVENNNADTTTQCWIEISGRVAAGNTLASTVSTANQSSIPAANASIYLAPGGGSYGRYTFTPQGPVVGTCNGTSGKSIYVDSQ